MAKGGYRGGFPGGNQAGMIKQAQKMQQDILKMQHQLEEASYEYTAGGGAVKAVVKGNRQFTDIVIDPDAVDADDVEMLQDLVLAAVNGALKACDDATEKAMGRIQGGMGLPF